MWTVGGADKPDKPHIGSFLPPMGHPFCLRNREAHGPRADKLDPHRSLTSAGTKTLPPTQTSIINTLIVFLLFRRHFTPRKTLALSHAAAAAPGSYLLLPRRSNSFGLAHAAACLFSLVQIAGLLTAELAASCFCVDWFVCDAVVQVRRRGGRDGEAQQRHLQRECQEGLAAPCQDVVQPARAQTEAPHR